jgi:hypothetical protein
LLLSNSGRSLPNEDPGSSRTEDDPAPSSNEEGDISATYVTAAVTRVIPKPILPPPGPALVVRRLSVEMATATAASMPFFCVSFLKVVMGAMLTFLILVVITAREKILGEQFKLLVVSTTTPLLPKLRVMRISSAFNQSSGID